MFIRLYLFEKLIGGQFRLPHGRYTSIKKKQEAP